MSVEKQNLATAPAATASTTELEGEALKRAVYKLENETLIKILKRQHGVPSFSDNTLLEFIKQLHQLDKTRPWEESARQLGGVQGKLLEGVLERLRILLKRRHQGRFIDYERRFEHSPDGPRSECEIGYYEFATSQGAEECMHWRGAPLFKTVYDFSIYSMMLWDIRPWTVIELGSGMGSSAVWLADLLKAFNINSHIYSVDLNKPDLHYDGITFLQGDCLKLETVFPRELLETAPHPWLFIEDAHVNVYGVLTHFHQYFTAGDYVVVEDSGSKHEEIGKFLAPRFGCYKIDTRYTDFFGRNATCARDSIFVRI
jgi:hypothetical protein